MSRSDSPKEAGSVEPRHALFLQSSGTKPIGTGSDAVKAWHAPYFLVGLLALGIGLGLAGCTASLSKATQTTVARHPENLLASAAPKSDLVAAFAQHDHIPPQDIVGLYPGSLHYAFQPSTNTYWAVAKMEPLITAPVAVTVKFQDGGDYVVFARKDRSSWSVVDLVGEPPCLSRTGLPRAIESLWGLRDASECQCKSTTCVG